MYTLIINLNSTTFVTFSKEIEVSEMSSYQYLKLLVTEYKDNLEVQSEM